jgi:hypothetical protein
MYNRALDSKGELWGKPVQLDDTGSQYCTLAVIKGNPAVVYWMSSSGELKYIRCADADGQTLAAWSNPSIVLKGPITVGEKPNLIDCNGNPAILYYEGGALKYRRATTANGTGNTLGDWADPEITVVAAGANNFQQLALISGKPALVYIDSANAAQYVRATSATGAIALDWPAATVKISGADMPATWCGLAQANGNPAVCWYDSALNGVKYVRATTTTGALIGDWPVAVTVVPGPSAGMYLSMAIIRGRPAIAYDDNSGTSTKRYVRALDTSGSAWGYPILAAGEPPAAAGQWCSLAEIAGQPGIAFHNNSADCMAYALPDLSL